MSRRDYCRKCKLYKDVRGFGGAYVLCELCIQKWRESPARTLYNTYFTQNNHEMMTKVDQMWLNGELD